MSQDWSTGQHHQDVPRLHDETTHCNQILRGPHFCHLNLVMGRIFLRRNLTGTCPWKTVYYFSGCVGGGTLWAEGMGRWNLRASKKTVYSGKVRYGAGEWPVCCPAHVMGGPVEGKGGWARCSCSCHPLHWSFWLGSVNSAALYSSLIRRSTWDVSKHHSRKSLEHRSSSSAMGWAVPSLSLGPPRDSYAHCTRRYLARGQHTKQNN